MPTPSRQTRACVIPTSWRNRLDVYDVDAIQPAAHRVSLFEGAEGGRWFSGKCQVTTSWPLDGSGCWSVLRSHMTCCHKSGESKPFFQALSGGKRRLMLGTLNALGDFRLSGLAEVQGQRTCGVECLKACVCVCACCAAWRREWCRHSPWKGEGA